MAQPNANTHGLEVLKKAGIEIDPGNPNELKIRVHIVSTEVDLGGGGGGLEMKAKKVPFADFTLVSGSYVYDVVFDDAFADDDYAVPAPSGADARIWSIENQVDSGFRINSNSATPLTAPVGWIAVKAGES